MMHEQACVTCGGLDIACRCTTVPPASEPEAVRAARDLAALTADEQPADDAECERIATRYSDDIVVRDDIRVVARHILAQHAAAERAREGMPEAVRIARAVAKWEDIDGRTGGDALAISFARYIVETHAAADRARESMPAMVRDAAARLAGETTAGHREMTDRALVECHAQLAASREECERVRGELGVERVLVKLADQRAAGSDRDAAALAAERDKLQAELEAANEALVILGETTTEAMVKLRAGLLRALSNWEHKRAVTFDEYTELLGLATGEPKA